MTEMLARTCGYEAKEFIHTIGDAHIYKDHFEVVKQQIAREPLPKCKLVLNPDVMFKSTQISKVCNDCLIIFLFQEFLKSDLEPLPDHRFRILLLQYLFCRT